MALALHGEDRLAAAVACIRALELGCLLDHGERGVEALVAQDGGDVLQAGHRVAELGAGQPVDRARRLDGVDGLAALQPDGVEEGQFQVRDQLWHAATLSAGPGFRSRVALRQQRHQQRLGRQVGQPGRGAVRRPGDHDGAAGGETLDGRPGHVSRRDPHELGQRLARLLVGHARRLGEARLHRAGAQRGDADARAAQLGAEGAPVGEHEGLRRAVAGLSRQRLEGRGRRRVEDRAAMPRDHARHEQRAQVDDGLDVRAHHGELGGAVGPVTPGPSS